MYCLLYCFIALLLYCFIAYIYAIYFFDVLDHFCVQMR